MNHIWLLKWSLICIKLILGYNCVFFNLQTLLSVCVCVVFKDYTVRTTVATRRGMKKTKSERIAVDRGQQTTMEEHRQRKWMATRCVISGCCTQKIFFKQTKYPHLMQNMYFLKTVVDISYSSSGIAIQYSFKMSSHFIDAVLTGWPDGCDVEVKTEELKDEGAIFFILSLLTKSWSTSSHESFTRFLPVNGHDVPNVHQMSSSRETLFWVDELFTDWWYSAERWTAAGSWKKPWLISPKSQSWGSISKTCIISVNKSWWTDLLIVTHCPYPHRLHDTHLLFLLFLRFYRTHF